MALLLENLFLCTGQPDGFVADAALLIEGDGVCFAGPAAEAPADLPPGTVRHDLGGAIVIPGLINTHAHGGMSLQRGCCDDGDLFQWAAALAPFTANLTLEDNRWGSWLAVMEMLRHGITTACDCTRYGVGVFAGVASEAGLRSMSGALANSPELRRNGRPNWPLALEETREAMARHDGDPLCRFYLGAHSPYSCTDALMVEVKAAARELGLSFVIHLAENRRETEIVRERAGTTPLRLMQRLGLLDRDTILAHCVWLDGEEIAILSESGAGVAHNPVSNAKLASGVAPVPAMRRAGVPVGLGTDSTVSNNCLSLFQEMKFSVLLQRAATLDGHALDAAAAFAMATREGARVLGWEAEIGTIEPGRKADLVVLDLDQPFAPTPDRVLSDIVYAAGPQHVRDVMVGGEWVLRQGCFTRFDEAAIRRGLRDHARR